MRTICSRCGAIHSQTAQQRSRNGPICDACRNERERVYRALRVAKGLPVRGHMSAEYHREYSMVYTQRPERKEANRIKSARRRLEESEQVKAKARRTLRSAIETGVIIRQSCVDCGASQTDAHHDDYSKPLDVRWLCRIHHRSVHAKATGAS